MNVAVEIALQRLCVEEGFRAQPYSDATGRRVTCADGGKMTWLYGLNLETEGTPELGKVIMRWKLEKLVASLEAYEWYKALSDARKSVMLDIAYNEGVTGLLHFPHMISAMIRGDWPTAQQECVVQDPRLHDRYVILGRILLSGVDAKWQPS